MRTSNAHKSLPKVRAQLSRAAEALYKKAHQHYKAGVKFEKAGDEVNAARMYKEAEKLMRRATGAGRRLPGPVGILPNPYPSEWDDVDEDAAFGAGKQVARALGRSAREHRAGAKFYHVTWYSPARGKRTGFIQPIEAHTQSAAIKQAKAMITNEPKASNFVAKETKRNPSGVGRGQGGSNKPRYGLFHGSKLAVVYRSKREADQALAYYSRHIPGMSVKRLTKGTRIEGVPRHNPKDFWTGKVTRENPGSAMFMVPVINPIKKGDVVTNEPKASNFVAKETKRNPSGVGRGQGGSNKPRYGLFHGSKLAVVYRSKREADQALAYYSRHIPGMSVKRLTKGTRIEGVPRHNPKDFWTGKVTRENPGSAMFMVPVINPIKKGDVVTLNDDPHKRLFKVLSVKQDGRVVVRRIDDKGKQFGLYRERWLDGVSSKNPGLVDLAANLQAADFVSKFVGGKKRRNPAKYRGYTVRHTDGSVSGSYPTKAQAVAALKRGRAQFGVAAMRGWRVVRDKVQNPSVTALSETFQGKASGSIAEFKAANSAPNDLARIGKLVFLKLRGAKQLRVPGAMVAADTRGKLWLTAKRAPMFTRKAAVGSMLDFGPIDQICYETAKAHIENGRVTEYVHTFGEDGGKKPHLCVDAEGMAVLRGGDYQIRSEGIVD